MITEFYTECMCNSHFRCLIFLKAAVWNILRNRSPGPFIGNKSSVLEKTRTSLRIVLLFIPQSHLFCSYAWRWENDAFLDSVFAMTPFYPTMGHLFYICYHKGMLSRSKHRIITGRCNALHKLNSCCFNPILSL